MQIYGEAFLETWVELRNLGCLFYKQTNTKFSQRVDESPTVGFGYSITENS